jgi:hypothetical protein
MSFIYALLAFVAAFCTLVVLAPEYNATENASQATGEAFVAATAVGIIVFLAVAGA